ncbi:MAG: nitroreductase family protein, partial [Chloroflexota bacterium]
MIEDQVRDGALLPEILRRRSVVAFDRRPIGKETLDALVEAARWAPSSRNRQPWRVTLVQRSDASRPALESALSGNNQQWAPDASLLVVYA